MRQIWDYDGQGFFWKSRNYVKERMEDIKMHFRIEKDNLWDTTT